MSKKNKKNKQQIKQKKKKNNKVNIKKNKKVNKKNELSKKVNKKIRPDEETLEYKFLEDTLRRFAERKCKEHFGLGSNALKALDLVCELMNAENGFVRDDGQAYYNHCITVGLTALNHGIQDEDIIAACFLHDVTEDIPEYSIKVIEVMFNKRIAKLVDLVTKKPGIDYHEKENLEEYLDNIESDIGAIIIKTADRMHNMMTLREKDLASKYKKAIETETFYMKRFKKWRKLHPRHEDLFFEARNTIEPLINEIKAMNANMNELVRSLNLSKKDVKKLEEKGITFYPDERNQKKFKIK